MSTPSPASAPAPAARMSPGERLTFVGLVVWVAFMGADRIDLAGGSFGFVFTPFLALTPLLLVLEGLRVVSLRLRVTPADRRASGYALVLACLVLVVLASSFAAVDVDTSVKRSLNLAAISVGTFLVALLIGRRPWAPRALATGAELGIAVALVFGVMQVATLLSGGDWILHAGPASVDLTPMVVVWFPRFGGQVKDANRAGLLLLLYVFLILLGRGPGVRRRVGVGVGGLLFLLTISRSAFLAASAAGAVAVLSNRMARISRSLALAGMVAVGAFLLLLLARPRMRDDLATVLEPVSLRLSPREGSAEEHAYLLSRGLEEATTSFRQASLGLGYGDSFTVLQDVFPGNRYGNFHSLYITMLAESGVLALLLTLLLLGYPFLRPGPFLPMVAALWFFDIFYQASAEPTFWLVLALAWLTSAAVPRRRTSSPQAETGGP